MNILTALNWGPTPEIFKIPAFDLLGFTIGPIQPRWYGLLFVGGFIIGYYLMTWVYKTEKKSDKDLESLIIYMLISTVVGARLGHCLFYDASQYLSNPIEILYIWRGGLASHGAGIGIFIGILLYARNRKGISIIWTFDRVAIAIPIAAAMVRIGNFVNSEIIGKPADLPWSIVFTKVDFIPRHPSQLYEAIAYIIIFLIIFFLYKKYKTETPKGLLSGLMLILLFSARFFIEFFKENQAEFESSLPIDMGQILSIPLVLLGIVLIIWGKKIKI